MTEKSSGVGDVVRRTHTVCDKKGQGTITTMSSLSGASIRKTTIAINEDGSVKHHEIVKNKKTFSETTLTLSGTKATGNLSTTYALEGESYIDLHVSSEHSAPDTTSTISTRGTLNGSSRADIVGNVIINKNAEKSSGYQSSTALLLSPMAVVNALPNLNIHNHDVTCSHSASVTTIDEEQVHYFRSRGIPERVAKSLLSKGFLSKGVSVLPVVAQGMAEQVLEATNDI